MDLRTPPEAMDAFSAKIRSLTDPADRLDALAGMEAAAALRAAAPLIVAALLERLVVEVDGARAGRADDWDRGWHAALDYVSRIIRGSVSELRGEQS